MISHYLHYQLALAALLLKGEINGATWRYAARHRPIVVIGRHGGLVVDATFDMTPAQRTRMSVIQFIVGMLLISGGVALLDVTLNGKGAQIDLWMEVLKGLALLSLGFIMALDASLIGANRWMRLPRPSRRVADADRA